MTFWACYAAKLTPAVAQDCDAHGEGADTAAQKAAEAHTRSAHHPTTTSALPIAWTEHGDG